MSIKSAKILVVRGSFDDKIINWYGLRALQGRKSPGKRGTVVRSADDKMKWKNLRSRR